MQRIESTLATAANGVRSGEDRQHQQQDILDQFAEQLRRIEHAVCRKDAHSSSKSKAPDGSIKWHSAALWQKLRHHSYRKLRVHHPALAMNYFKPNCWPVFACAHWLMVVLLALSKSCIV
eukprot:5710577-Pleurochrysis_carterae.AAC.1